MPQSQELVDYVKGINKDLAIQTVHTDKGSEFTSGTWLKELSGMGIGKTKSLLIYSQTNGISERVIQTVQEKIGTDCSNDSLKKKTANTTKLKNQLLTSSTKFTPNEILVIIIKKQTDQGMEENEKLEQVLKNILSYNKNMS
jgi:transposase InsO family protein